MDDFSFFDYLSPFCFLFIEFYCTSSVSLSYFILAVPMHECLGKYSCTSSPFPIAILNGTYFPCFLTLVGRTLFWLESAIKLNTIIIIHSIYVMQCLPSYLMTRGAGEIMPLLLLLQILL